MSPAGPPPRTATGPFSPPWPPRSSSRVPPAPSARASSSSSVARAERCAAWFDADPSRMPTRSSRATSSTPRRSRPAPSAARTSSSILRRSRTRGAHATTSRRTCSARSGCSTPRHGVGRFVHVSTRAISETGGAYSHSKLQAERAVTEAPVEHTIVRLSEMYGGAGAEGIDEIVSRARRGAAIPMVGKGAERVCPMQQPGRCGGRPRRRGGCPGRGRTDLHARRGVHEHPRVRARVHARLLHPGPPAARAGDRGGGARAARPGAAAADLPGSARATACRGQAAALAGRRSRTSDSAPVPSPRVWPP